MASLTVEQMRILYFNRTGGMLLDERVYDGTATEVEVRFHEVVRHAFMVNSPTIVLAHNHPSGNPNPSTQDIRYTQKIVGICKSLDLQVHDHIIIAREGSFSFRELGYM